ncbi:nuclear hormone receptor E75-like protein [Aphelenchoides avenae]|nr:nuclear hormone receptor E75-like protein [Aphelenchus avenae]
MDSPINSVSSSPPSLSDKQELKCEVCGANTKFKHYGASACYGCAAFFRRTVANSRTYKCECRGGPLTARNKGKCQHCRFERCLEAGMNMSEVKVVKAVPGISDSTLANVVACRNRLYVRKRQHLKELNFQLRPGSPATKPGCDIAYTAELRILNEFLSGRCHLRNYLASEITCKQVAHHFFPIWVVFEKLYSTLKHGRLEVEVSCLDEASILRVSYDGLLDFYKTHTEVKDPYGLANMAIENFEGMLRAGRSFRRATLDDFEVAAFILLLISHYERGLFVSREAHKEFTDRAFRELNEHYKSTYWEYAERLGTVISLLSEFHTLFRASEELYALINLYSYNDTSKEPNVPSMNYVKVFEFRRSLTHV